MTRRDEYAAAIRERRAAVRAYEASRDLLDYGRVAEAFRAEGAAWAIYWFLRSLTCKT